MLYTDFQKYKLSESVFAESGAEKVMKLRHHFYTPHEIDLSKAFSLLNPFPVELKIFYEEVGFGFMHRKNGKINRLLDPVSLFMINLLQGDFQYNPEIKYVVNMCDIDKQLLFFQTQSGKYLLIDRHDIGGKNAIYYQKEQLTSSFAEFISIYHNDKYWLTYMTSE